MAVSDWSNWQLGPIHTIDESGEKLTILATGKNQNITVVVPVESNEEYNFSMLVDGGGTIVIRELINSTDSDALGTPVLEVVSPIVNGHEIQETLKITDGKFVRVTISSGERGAGTYSFTNPSLVKKEVEEPEIPEEPVTVDLLPNLSSSLWNKHANFKLSGDDAGTLISIGNWEITSIIVDAKPNKEYIVKVKNPNNGVLFIKEIDNSGNENDDTSVYETAANIDKTFRTTSTVSKLHVAITNADKGKGNFYFENPSLLTVRTDDTEPDPPTDPDLNVIKPFSEDINYLRGINMGNGLEAPNDEGEWGLVLEDKYFTEIKNAGFNLVRIPIRWSAHSSNIAPYTINEDFINRVDHVVDKALSLGLKVIINIHHFDEIMDNPTGYKDKYLSLWSQIANRYQSKPSDLMFELLNEPKNGAIVNYWNQYIVEGISTIRSTNPTRKIVFGSAYWHDIDYLDTLQVPANDRNLIATFHYYDPYAFTHQGAPFMEGMDQYVGTKWQRTESEKNEVINALDKVVVWANNNNIHVLMGEFGSIDKADMTSRALYTDFLAREAEKRNISWAYWEFGTTFGAYDQTNQQWRSELIQALIPEYQPDQQPVDILPNLNTWLKHPTVTFNSAEQATVSPTGQPWQHAWISVNVEPNIEYTFSVENPNSGLAYAHEVDANGNEINLVFYEQTTNVTKTFTTRSNTRSLLIRLSSGEKTNGTYVFKNPTLVKGNILPQPVDILPNLNTWLKHPTVTFNSAEQATVSPTGQPWQHAWISVNVEPNTEYTFAVENPNSGLAYAHEVDVNGNEINLVFYEQTASVTKTFTTRSNTRSLLIRLSSGEKTNGSYIFRNPTLVMGDTLPDPNPPSGVQLLRVLSNGRYLMTNDDGKPFFWMSDTAWTLAQEVSQSDVDIYLQNRKDKGFTVIMMNALPFGRFIPNEFGEHPLTNTSNVTAFNEVYWRRIDYIINRAESMGMYVYLLPAWGSDGINGGNQNGALLSPSTVGLATAENNAYNYGVKLGQRYAVKKNIIWALGGDTEPTRNVDARNVYRRLASGLDAGDGNSDFLTTYHHAYGSSSNWFHSEGWLDFNNIQSSHMIDTPNYNLISQDYAKSPVKPTIDIEPRYEDIPSHFWENNGTGPRIRDFDVRQAVYWQLFAGAMGVSYGHNSVWQFWDGEGRDATMPDIYWKPALDRPGAYSMSHLKSLITNTARDFSKMTPDQSYITSANPNDPSYKVASVASNRMFAYVYMPYGGNVTVNLAKLSGSNAKAQWFNPRTGQYISIGNVTISGTRNFSVPANGNYGAGQTARGNDFVLVVEVI